MKPFTYEKATSLAATLTAIRDPETRVIAGGTELVNWMKDGIDTPSRLIDITGLPLATIEVSRTRLRLGALARMSDVAEHPDVVRDYPVLSQALWRSASPQLRNMATMGGNLMQRTRCPYFRSETRVPCNKRWPGSGCAAMHGDNRSHAILGWSQSCVATHPSDLAVALAALDAVVRVSSATGSREIRATDFHRLPGSDPRRDNTLAPGELITAIDVPADPSTARSYYLKVRERASYEFAMVSAAVTLDLEGDGEQRTIRRVRIALGGVAQKPWRLARAELALRGKPWTTDAMTAAIRGSLADARALSHNEFKIGLAERTVVRALEHAGGLP
jgi:xanthine dehydrogenase YagS FAD-binding subunit